MYGWRLCGRGDVCGGRVYVLGCGGRMCVVVGVCVLWCGGRLCVVMWWACMCCGVLGVYVLWCGGCVRVVVGISLFLKKVTRYHVTFFEKSDKKCHFFSKK